MKAVLLKAGPLSTVQDGGRATGRRKGLSPGGAMDRWAYHWANRLLDNPPGAPALEVALGGIEIHFSTDGCVALTGAECNATLDGSEVPNWATVRVVTGQRLRLGFSATGMRAYIAFPGGLRAPKAFGSASVVLREGLDGPLGEPLQDGSDLAWLSDSVPPMIRRVPHDLVPATPTELELSLIVGYEWHEFSQADREAVWRQKWTVTPSSDRVACRLDGPTLESGPRILDSTPLVDGTVQVPGDGRPLVFLRDRPTVGGYAKLGSVDPMGLDRLAQARPGTRVRFVPADAAKVLAELRRRRAFFRSVE